MNQCEWEKDFATLANKVGGILGAEKLIRDKAALLEALEAMLLEWDEPTLACDEARAAIAQAKGEK